MNASDPDRICIEISNIIPLEYFRNLVKHRQYITADIYTTVLKTETQGSWADGFAVLGTLKSDFDIACPINNCLSLSENCKVEIKFLHPIVENPCYVRLEINPQLPSNDSENSHLLTDLVCFKNGKLYLSLTKLRKKILTKVNCLSVTNSFLTSNVTTSEANINKSNPCFTIQFNLSISKTIEPLQNLITYFRNICEDIYKNEINALITLICAYMEVINQCGFNDILNFDIEKFLKEYDWIENIKSESNSLLKELFEEFKDPIYFEYVIRVRNDFIRFSFKFLLYFLKSVNLEQIFYEICNSNNIPLCNTILDPKFQTQNIVLYSDLFISLECQKYLKTFTDAMSEGIQYCKDQVRKVIKHIEVFHKGNKDIFLSFQYAIDYFAAKTSLNSLQKLKNTIQNMISCDQKKILHTVIQTLKELSDISLQFVLAFNDSQLEISCFQNEFLQSDVRGHYSEIIRKIRGARLENAELVPCFKFSGWPSVALPWISRKRYWPSSCVANEILNNGYHAVLKATPNGDPELEARLSFSNAEIILFKNFNFIQEIAFYIFKLIYYLELQSFDSLSTYYMKTIAFWAFEQYPPEFWNEDSSAAICILQMLQRLHEVASSGVLPHYFIPKQNLFISISREELNLVADKVKIISTDPFSSVEKVCHYISNFIDPYLNDFWKPYSKLRSVYFYSEQLTSYIASYVKSL